MSLKHTDDGIELQEGKLLLSDRTSSNDIRQK